MPETSVAIVGGGIVGLAHAWEAARRGYSVTLFERHAAAQGASIRNFGMIWPIGQPPGERLHLALASQAVWRQIVQATGLPVVSEGSIHLAYRPDEEAVIREFIALSTGHGYVCRWMGPREVLQRCPAVRHDGLLGGLYSDTELVVDPRQVTRTLPLWLAEQFGVTLRYGCAVTAIEGTEVHTPEERWKADRIVVCGGDDFASLYPSVFAASPLIRCKLQMMRTGPQPAGFHLGTALASGLTLRFYTSFGICPSLPALQQRIAHEMPDFDRFGIHVMAAETPAGEITLGDSHEYGADISIFDKPEIEDLILQYLRAFLDLPDPQIRERWHGIYSKHPAAPFFLAEPEKRVRIVTGLGGAGMTLSFGVAQKTWSEWI